jgi:hypothetical protein
MKRWMVIFILALFVIISFSSDAAARRRHRYGYGYGLSLLFLLPLYSGLYHNHSHDHYYPRSPSPHYPGRYNSFYMNQSDRFLLSEKTHYTLEKARSGTEIKWFNPNTGVEGTVVARPAFKNTVGQYCRAYEQIIRYGSWTRRGTDTACRLPDGRWENIPSY